MTTTDPHVTRLYDCPRGHTFEDLVVAAPGWCPTCDEPVSRMLSEEEPRDDPEPPFDHEAAVDAFDAWCRGQVR